MAALPLFVAAGYFGARIVSDDGRRWRNLVLTRDGHVFKGVCFGNGVFVASGTGGGPTIHSVTSDGIVWRNVYVPEAKNPGTGVKGNAFGNRHFIAFGGDGSPFGSDGNNNVVHSLDGLKWSEIIYPKNKRLLRRVAFGNGIFVGVGDLGRRGSSINGIEWRDAPQNVPKRTIVDVAFGNGIFVGVGLHSLRMTTRDGITWTEPLVGEEGEHLNSVVWAGDRFVAAGPDVTYFSHDAVNWKRSPNKNGPLTMTYGSGAFVGAAWKGRLLYSTDAVEWIDVHQMEYHIETLASSQPGGGAPS